MKIIGIELYTTYQDNTFCEKIVKWFNIPHTYKFAKKYYKKWIITIPPYDKTCKTDIKFFIKP